MKNQLTPSLGGLVFTAIVVVAMTVGYGLTHSDQSTSHPSATHTVATSATAVTLSPELADCKQMFAFEVNPHPAGPYQNLCRKGYAIIHDNAHKLPFLAAELLTPDTIGRGKVKRTDNFRSDTDLPKDARSLPKDYVGTIYDKGHLADAQNAGSPDLMSETFLMSNMTPQVFSINRGPWKQLETRVATWVRNGRTLIVYSGVILGGDKTIGNSVAVPTKLFKVIIDTKQDDAIAFIIPNVEGKINDWKQYRATIADVEKATNVDMLPGATESDRKILENAQGLSLMPK